MSEGPERREPEQRVHPHIDTAERYGNETEVGEGLAQGLRAAGLRREDVFVTTKVYHDKLAAADFQRSFDESLQKLKLPWVDLLLIHWPNPKVPLAETLEVLCEAKRNGRAKHVGVANFTVVLNPPPEATIDEALAPAAPCSVKLAAARPRFKALALVVAMFTTPPVPVAVPASSVTPPEPVGASATGASPSSSPTASRRSGWPI